MTYKTSDISGQDEAILQIRGHDLLVIYNGVKIAKRGHPGTPQAKTWVSLEPGYAVYDGPKGKSLVIECNGVRVQ